MFWRLAYKVANALIKRKKIANAIIGTKKLGGVIEKATAKSYHTLEEPFNKARKKIQNVIVKKNKELVSLFDKYTPLQVSKRVITNRLLNKYGSLVFGELYYYARYGIVDNFFWEHPFLDTLFHPKDKDKWSFLAQWCTLYKLPPIIRTPIRMFITQFKLDENSMVDAIWRRIEDKFDRELTKQEEIYVHKEIRAMKRASAQEDCDWFMLALETTPFYMIDAMVDALVKYVELQTDKYTIGWLRRFIKTRRNQTPWTNPMKLKIILLCNRLNIEPIRTIRFVPHSPETGNFLLCILRVDERIVELKINNVWYKNKAASYYFDTDYELMYKCIATRNFGKLYWSEFDFRPMGRPKVPYKKTNFNGSGV